MARVKVEYPSLEGLNPNIAARLGERAREQPDWPALVEPARGRARRTTFGELAERVSVAAGTLQRRGVAPGDRVLLFVPMSIDLYVALLSCCHLGATAVFLDAWADRTRFEAALEAAGPRAFLGTPKAHLLRLVSPGLRRIPIHMVSGWERPGKPAELALVERETPALVTFTTGSTGRPRAACRSHGFLWAQHRALSAHLKLRDVDVDLPTLPIFVLNNLAAGVTSVLPDFDPRKPAELDPARVHRQIVAERVTTSSGSPSFYTRLADWCHQRGVRLPLRAVFTGGAPVLPGQARRMQDVLEGCLHVVYGSTEAEPIAGIECGELLEAASEGRDGLCVGRAVPHIDLRLLRPCDEPIALDHRGLESWEVEPGEVGEVVVAGRHVLPGYLDDPEGDRRNKIRQNDRVWHRTGDAAWRDEKGRLWLMGRVSERVQREERVLWSLPAVLRAVEEEGVTHAAYFGMPDPDLGHRAVLCVESRRPDLSDALTRRLAPYPVDELRVLDRIPRDPRHATKTDLAELKRQLHPP
ncbi:MAG: AMP-binding protein [Candidatus Eremiobacterota bacterium]